MTITGMLASFTMVLSGTIVNVAVPHAMGAFGIGQSEAQFMATAYIATMTASQLLNAWFVALLGQRLTFLVVLTIFAAGTLLAAVSPNLDTLIFGRIMQGFASGIIQPLVMVTIFGVFPAARRGTAMGIYSMGLVLALGLGPVVGGITVDTLGWRYIFYLPLPLVAAAALLGLAFIPNTGARSHRVPFDWAGYALLCGGIYCLMTAIANGHRDGWDSNSVLILFSAGGIASIAFVRSQLRASAALLDLSLLAKPQFAAAALLAFIYGFGNFSMTYAVPVFGQLVQGFNATLAGFILLPAGLVLVALVPITGRLSDRVPPQYPIYGGLLLFAAGTWWLAQGDVGTGIVTMATAVAIGRMGMGFITPALMSGALTAVDSDRLNAASGSINFFRQLGGAFGINLFVAGLEGRTQFHADVLTATQDGNSTTRALIEQTTRALAPTGYPEDLRISLALDHLGQMIHAQAQTFAFQDGFRMVSLVFCCALVPAWLFGRHRPVSPPPRPGPR